MFGTFSKANFIAWNPIVGSDCTNLVDSTFYCVSIPGTPTTRKIPKALLHRNLTRQNWPFCSHDRHCGSTYHQRTDWNANAEWTCLVLHQVLACLKVIVLPLVPILINIISSDNCVSIASNNGITEAQLLNWNPALGTSTQCNPVPEYYVCVAVTPSTTQTPSTTTGPTSTSISSSSISSTTTTSAGGAVTTPDPHQVSSNYQLSTSPKLMITGGYGKRMPKILQDPTRWWLLGHSKFRWYWLEVRFRGPLCLISTLTEHCSDFYAWNPAVGACEGLWADTWYCIGISGSVTSISSGPPVPT